MASEPKVPEAMKWEQEQAAEGGDKLSCASAPNVEPTITYLSRLHSADQAPGCPGLLLGFPARLARQREEGGRTPKPTSNPLMGIQIERLARILGRFDPKRTKSQDKQHLAFSSLPTDVLLTAQELLKVKTHWKSGDQIVGRELSQIDDQLHILDPESQNVKETFATQVPERLGETDEKQTRQEAVPPQLHAAVQGTDEQSMQGDLILDREIFWLHEQHKRELDNHDVSINLVKEVQRTASTIERHSR